jgi:hypothetical protein
MGNDEDNLFQEIMIAISNLGNKPDDLENKLNEIADRGVSAAAAVANAIAFNFKRLPSNVQ